MRGSRALWLIVLLLAAAVPAAAQRHSYPAIRGNFPQTGGFRHHGGGGSFRGGYGYGVGFGYKGFRGGFSHNYFSPSVFAPPPFDYGYSGYGGYGGYGYYPAHFPPYPYPAPMPQQTYHPVLVMEATHDWRNWSPTTKIITGPVARTDERVIGMGVPQWAMETPPLGDVARRNREAQSRPADRAVYRFVN